MIACKNNLSVEVPPFDKTNAFGNVRQQVNFGPRVPGSEGHIKCKDWIVSQFKGASIYSKNV